MPSLNDSLPGDPSKIVHVGEEVIRSVVTALHVNSGRSEEAAVDEAERAVHASRAILEAVAAMIEFHALGDAADVAALINRGVGHVRVR